MSNMLSATLHFIKLAIFFAHNRYFSTPVKKKKHLELNIMYKKEKSTLLVVGINSSALKVGIILGQEEE